MSLLRELTDQDAHDAIIEVCDSFRFKPVEKRKSKLFLAAADLLDELHAYGLDVPTGEVFLSTYWTGIGLPRGTGADLIEESLLKLCAVGSVIGIRLAPKVAALLTAAETEHPDALALIGLSKDPSALNAADLPRSDHECRHCWDASPAGMGALKFILEYLCLQAERALGEARAVISADELLFSMWGAAGWASPKDHAQFFAHGYALAANHVAMIEGAITSAHATLLGGVSLCPVARAFKGALASRGIISPDA